MHQLEFQIDRVKDLPDSAYWQMLESTAELRRQEVSAARAYDEGLQRLKKEYLSRLRALFINSQDGKKKLDKYLAFGKEQRAKLRAARREVTPTPQSHQEFDRIRQRLVEKSKTLIRQSGINTAQIKSLRQDVEKQREALFKATVGQGEVVAEKSRKRAKNATFNPPYDGTVHALGITRIIGDSSDNFNMPTASMFTNAANGTLGMASNARLWDASDYDVADVIVRTGMVKWFRMPTPGQLRVSCKAEVIGDFYMGRVVNEPWDSDVAVRQNVMFYAQILSPLPTNGKKDIKHRIILGGLYYDLNDDDHSWNGSRWSVGTVRSMSQMVFGSTITNEQIFPKDTIVVVEVGIYHHNYFSSNDCGVWSNHGTNFWIKEIGLSSTGP